MAVPGIRDGPGKGEDEHSRPDEQTSESDEVEEEHGGVAERTSRVSGAWTDENGGAAGFVALLSSLHFSSGRSLDSIDRMINHTIPYHTLQYVLYS